MCIQNSHCRVCRRPAVLGPAFSGVGVSPCRLTGISLPYPLSLSIYFCVLPSPCGISCPKGRGAGGEGLQQAVFIFLHLTIRLSGGASFALHSLSEAAFAPQVLGVFPSEYPPERSIGAERRRQAAIGCFGAIGIRNRASFVHPSPCLYHAYIMPISWLYHGYIMAI